MTAYLNDVGLICCLGAGKREVSKALFAADLNGMQVTDAYTRGAPLVLGQISSALPPIPAAQSDLKCRNNQLTVAALQQIRPAIDSAVNKFGNHRVGVIMGTSTSGVSDGESALRQRLLEGEFPPEYSYRQQELGSCSDFVAAYLGTTGPSYTISTACSSSANALFSAQRLLNAGLCDAVVAGGTDSLSEMTVRGFSALEAVSSERCNPFSINRKGINIGEASAIFLVSRDHGPVAICGYGASSDAHHISAPHPEGRGAKAAMTAALQRAGVRPDDVDYINLHGTATKQNDAMESLAVTSVFKALPPASSTKSLTGHTLGAAGALEAAFCWLALSKYNVNHQLPPHIWDGQPDPNLPTLPLVSPDTTCGGRPRICLSNSFAFGGNNTATLLKRVDHD